MKCHLMIGKYWNDEDIKTKCKQYTHIQIFKQLSDFLMYFQSKNEDKLPPLVPGPVLSMCHWYVQ